MLDWGARNFERAVGFELRAFPHAQMDQVVMREAKGPVQGQLLQLRVGEVIKDV